MNEYTVIKSSRSENGIICHVVDTGDSLPKEMRYTTVRGGLSWPNQGAPGYYIIFGQIYGGISRFNTGKHQKKPLRFLVEFESSKLREFFKRLVEDTAMFLCQSYYTNRTELWKGYEESLSDHCRANQIAVKPSIDDAVFVENFQYGANLIKERLMDGALLIPQRSVLYSQLSEGGIKESDFGDVNIAVQFYAINALRYAVTAFDYHNFGPSKPIRSGRRRDGRVV